MNRATRVVIDSLRGEALLGETVVAIADAGSRGELQVGGPGGPILRPLTFGERTRAVSRAALSPRPRENVCAAILDMATVQPGAAGQATQEILALTLAGADQEDAPSFAEAALLVARGTGWGPAQLADAPAAEVDRIAIHLGGRRRESSWSRLLLVSNPGDELASIRADLADALLKRAETAPQDAEARQPPPEGGAFENTTGGTGPASRPGTGPAGAATRPNRMVGSGPGHSHTRGGVGLGAATPPATPGSGPAPFRATSLTLHSDTAAGSQGDERQRAPTSGPAGTAPPGEKSRQPPHPGHDRPIRFRIRNGTGPRPAPEPATIRPADVHDAHTAHNEPVRLIRLDGTEAPLLSPSNGTSLPAAQNPYPHPNPTQITSGTHPAEGKAPAPAATGGDSPPGRNLSRRDDSPPKAKGKPGGGQPGATTLLAPAASSSSISGTMGGLGGRQTSAMTMAATMTSPPPATQGQSNTMAAPLPTLDSSALHRVGGAPANEQPGLAAALVAGSPGLHQLAEPLPGGGDSLSELADALAALLHDEADMRGIER